MNVRDFAALLAAYPDQDATVDVLEHTPGRSYYSQGGDVKTVEFDPTKHMEYVDMRGNPHVKPDRLCYNRRYLFLGGRE